MSELQDFRKKPVVVQATQWFKNGDHPEDHCGESMTDPVTGEKYTVIEGELVRYFQRPDVPGESSCSECGLSMNQHGWIDTLEGGHIVCPGDWIITGVQGEYYPCKPDIFIATYEDASVLNTLLAQVQRESKSELVADLSSSIALKEGTLYVLKDDSIPVIRLDWIAEYLLSKGWRKNSFARNKKSLETLPNGSILVDYKQDIWKKERGSFWINGQGFSSVVAATFCPFEVIR